MKLQKFFRENQKLLMGVLGTVLVVAWLLGDALMSLLQPSGGLNLTIPTRYGNITGTDLAEANTSGEMINLLDPSYSYATPVDNSIPNPPLELFEWVALDREARANGFAVPMDAVAWQFQDPQATEALDEIAHNRRIRKEHLFTAFARKISIQSFADAATAAAVPSLAEVRQLAHRALEKVKVHAVTMPAGAFEDESATFTDDELQKQFDAYKDSRPGSGLDFGYMLDDAVRVEYLELDRNVIQENLKVDAARLERDARRFWEENRTNVIFRRPVPPAPSEDEQAAVEQDAPSEDESGNAGRPPEDADISPPRKDGAESGDKPADSEPAPPEERGGPFMGEARPAVDGGTELQEPTPAQDSQPAAEKKSEPAEAPAPQGKPESSESSAPQPPKLQPSVYYTTWEEARDTAIDHLRKQKALDAANSIVDFLSKRLDDPWLGLKTGPDGYKTAPETVKSAEYYAQMAALAEKEFGYTGAIRIGRTEMFTRNEAGAQPDIGTAVYFQQGRMRSDSLATLAFTVQGLTPVPRNADRFRFLSLYQTSRYPLSTFRDNKVYLFRVIDVRPSRAPQSLDEVRDRVVKDLRLKAGFETAAKRAEALMAAAGASALKDAFEADASLAELNDKGVAFHDPAPVSLYIPGFTGDLTATPFVSLGSAGAIPADTARRIFTLAHANPPRLVLPIEARATVLVVEWKETLPAREDALAQYLKQQVPRLLQQRARLTKLELTRPSNVRARNGLPEPDEGSQ